MTANGLKTVVNINSGHVRVDLQCVNVLVDREV